MNYAICLLYIKVPKVIAKFNKTTKKKFNKTLKHKESQRRE